MKTPFQILFFNEVSQVRNCFSAKFLKFFRRHSSHSSDDCFYTSLHENLNSRQLVSQCALQQQDTYCEICKSKNYSDLCINILRTFRRLFGSLQMTLKTDYLGKKHDIFLYILRFLLLSKKESIQFSFSPNLYFQQTRFKVVNF